MKTIPRPAVDAKPENPFVAEDGITPIGTIVRLNIPVDIAKLLYHSSGHDPSRDILCSTVCIQNRGDRVELAATDTHRLYITHVDHLGTMFPIGQGVYRWVVSPIKGRQLLERVVGQYPNYIRVLPDETAIQKCGRFRYEGYSNLWCSQPLSVNTNLLPQVKSDWELYVSTNAEKRYKPILFKGAMGKYVLMPLNPDGMDQK